MNIDNLMTGVYLAGTAVVIYINLFSTVYARTQGWG